MTPIEDSRPFRVASQLTVVLAILAASSLGEDGWTRGAVAAALSIVGAWVSWHRRGARNGWIKLALAVGMMAAFWRFLNDALYNPYDTRLTLANLLVDLQVLHSFDLPRRKDLYYSILVSIALVSVVATVSRTLDFLVWLLPWTITLLVATGLGHLARFRAADSAHWRVIRPYVTPLPLLTVLAMGVWFVLPRYEGMQFQHLPVSIRLPTPPGFSGQIQNPAYPSEAQREGRARTTATGRLPFNPKAYYGFSYNLYLNYRGQLDEGVVMRVRSRIPTYWRGMAFDRYDGVSWSMTEPDKTRRYNAYRPPIMIRPPRDEARPERVARRELIQTFYLESDQSNLIFAAPEVESLFFPTAYVLEDRYEGLRSPVQLSKGMVYSVVSQIPRFDPPALRRARPVPEGRLMAPYLNVAASVPERVHELARRITAGQTNAYDRIDTLSDYLSTRYEYRLDIPPNAPGHDPVDDFLFLDKAGYCEQFASALAVMGRSLGVPTRLVTGFTSGTLNPLTGYWEVKGNEAHAWVEAFFPDFGWVPFDPSPGFVAPLNPEEAIDPLQQFGRALMTWLKPRLPLPDGVAIGPALLGGLGLVASGLACLVVLTKLVRTKQAEPADQLDRLYWRVRARARRRGISDTPGTSPRRFAEQAIAMDPGRQDAWEALTALYERQHYGREPISAEELETARQLARRLTRRETADDR